MITISLHYIKIMLASNDLATGAKTERYHTHIY